MQPQPPRGSSVAPLFESQLSVRKVEDEDGMSASSISCTADTAVSHHHDPLLQRCHSRSSLQILASRSSLPRFSPTTEECTTTQATLRHSRRPFCDQRWKKRCSFDSERARGTLELVNWRTRRAGSVSIVLKNALIPGKEDCTVQQRWTRRGRDGTFNFCSFGIFRRSHSRRVPSPRLEARKIIPTDTLE